MSSQRHFVVDAGLAAVAGAASLALIAHGGVPGWLDDGFARHRDATTGLDRAAVVLALCASAPVVAARRRPLAVFAFVGAASALLVALGYPLWMPVGAGLALFRVAAGRDAGRPWTRHTTAAVLGVFGVYAGAAAVGERGLPEAALLHGGLAFAIAWFAGERARLRREHLTELEQRAAREQRLAVAEERARIARDLHDAAGHAINVITVRAGAARSRRDPERAHAALELIEDLARQTAAEIDAIVGALREPHEAPAAPASLTSLASLIAHHASAGLAVCVERRGDPRPLDSTTDQAAYRILQEALTNAARHGTGTARLDLAFGTTALELAITNPAPAGAPPRSNGGHGLIGMRERAALVGGRLDCERLDGCFRVLARLPYHAARK